MMEMLKEMKTDAEMLKDLQEQVSCLQEVIDEIASEMCDNVDDVLSFEEAYEVNVSDSLYNEYLMIEDIRNQEKGESYA